MSQPNCPSFAPANAKTKNCISGPVGDQAPDGTADSRSRVSVASAKPASAPAARSGGDARQRALDTVRKMIARLIRRHRLDYAAFETVCKAARKETGLRR